MAYTPTNWANGDTITAEKLNKIEQGIVDSGALFVRGEGYGSVIQNYQKDGAVEPSTASGKYSSALGGGGGEASGDFSFSTGSKTKATGVSSAAFGNETVASGKGSAAFGTALSSAPTGTTASALAAFAAGASVVASGSASQAFGQKGEASAALSTVFGNGSQATGRSSMVIGQFNVADDHPVDASHGSGARKYILIVGNGTADNARSNALTVDWSGNEELAGSITLGKGTADEVTLTAAQLKALLALLS